MIAWDPDVEYYGWNHTWNLNWAKLHSNWSICPVVYYTCNVAPGCLPSVVIVGISIQIITRSYVTPRGPFDGNNVLLVDILAYRYFLAEGTVLTKSNPCYTDQK
jgi:hypothetical protein